MTRCCFAKRDIVVIASEVNDSGIVVKAVSSSKCAPDIKPGTSLADALGILLQLGFRVIDITCCNGYLQYTLARSYICCY